MKLNLEKIFPICFGIFLLTYLLLRITNVAITDDEYMSLYYHIRFGYLSILTTGNPNLDWTANNHVMNSLCMKLGMVVFGEYDWAVRWQCIAAFVICYFFIWKIISSFTSSLWRVAIYLIIFFLNAYLLEFFALARGYCLSIAGWSMATYYFLKFCEKNDKKSLVFSLLGLFISVYANFSAVYFLVLFGLAFLFEIYKKKESPDAKKYFLILLGGYTLIALIIALPLYRTLQSTEIVSGGSNSLFKDYLVSYINQFINFNWQICKDCEIVPGFHQKELYAALLMVLWFALQFFAVRINSNEKIKNIHRQIFLQSIGLVVMFKLFYIFFHTPYPINRATLLFSFPMILCGVVAFERIAQRHKLISLSFIFVVPFFVWHAYFCFNIKQSIEWWRAGDAKNVLQYMKKIYDEDKMQKLITLGTEGMQFCGLAFYGETIYKNEIKVNWRQVEGNEPDDYLFVAKEMNPLFLKNFTAIKEFNNGFLMKKIK